MTLHSFDREVDTVGEGQAALEWRKKTIIDADGLSKTILFIELESIEMKKLDARSSRPLYSAKLCQLQFQIKMKVSSFLSYSFSKNKL